MKRKYLVIPGNVISQNDGQKHRIGPFRLITLYGVLNEECVIGSEKDAQAWKGIVLRPDPTGRYLIPTPENGIMRARRILRSR